MNSATDHATVFLPEDDSFGEGALPKGARLQNGAFEIAALLGQGGQSFTYRGWDISLQRAVAIREFFPRGSARRGAVVVPPSAMTNADFLAARENFGRQANVLARFSDESIVRVFRVFEENDSTYLVLELLEGQTLAQRLHAGALPVDEAVPMATRIGGALALMHGAGWLHCAIAPANIFLTRDHRAVLIDFAAAREISHASSDRVPLLNPGYDPLEFYSAQAPLGAPSDIYSLGATLYHALTGSAPASPPDRLAGADLPAPEKINPQISSELSRVVMHALEIQSQNRFQSARELVDALADALKNARDSSAVFALSPDVLSPDVPPVPHTPPTPPPVSRTPAAPPRKSSAATVSLSDAPRAPEAGSTPAPTMPRGAAPSVPQSTPVLEPGMQFCPHCHSPMPAVMSRCPHCRQLKNKAVDDPDSGTFREWHRNENTRVALGWALAILFCLFLLIALVRGFSAIGLKPEHIQQNGILELPVLNSKDVYKLNFQRLSLQRTKRASLVEG
jgi:serine/threonine-protein kinase